MKKLLMLIIVSLSLLTFSCNPKKEIKDSKPEVDYIYEATLDNFKIGNPELVVKVQEMHMHLMNKNYEMVSTYFTDNIFFQLEDGSVLEGKEEVMKFMIDSFSSIEIENYQIGVNFAVTTGNGKEWVCLWDSANIVLEDGTSSSHKWMEAFRFDKDKIDVINQFGKPKI